MAEPPAPRALVLAAALALPLVSSAIEIPYLSGRVNDLADLLSPETERQLESRLAELEETTGTQVAILTIPSLEGEVLEDYSLQVAETWELGRGAFDDGALLLIARDERKMRLEIGYGLEPVLTDALCRRILDEILRPHFRAGEFDDGVDAAVEAIVMVVKGEGELPPPARGRTDQLTRDKPSLDLEFLLGMIPLGVFSLIALATPGCVSWVFYFVLMPFWVAFPLATLGRPFGLIPIVLWIVGFPLLWRLLHRTPAGRGWVSSLPRHFSSGGGWSSSSGGFGGGFSGGGGSFGGGGASSSW